MTMPPRLRMFVLTVHVASSVGLLGAVAAFLALAVVGLSGADAEIVRGCYVAMGPIAWLVIVPLALASLLVGLVQSLGTPWGVFRHYWIVAKLLLTIAATIILLLQMTTIDYVTSAAAAMPLSAGDLIEARLALLVHSAGGLAVLVVPVALSVYKPRGTTPFGRRYVPAA